MPDIFGRERSDYTHIRAIESQFGDGAWDDHQEAQRQNVRLHTGREIPAHDFDALQIRSEADILQRAPDDATAIGFLTNNLLAIQSQVDEVLYTAFRLPDFLSLNESVPEGPRTYGVRVMNRVGRAVRVSPDADDAPVATVSSDIVPHPLHYYGLDAKWTVEELRGAMFAGVPLDTYSVDAAVTGHLETMEAVGLTGGGYAETGLLNHPTGTGDNQVRTAAQGASMTFAEITAVDIRNLINGDISRIIENTRETIGRNINTGMSVYLPGEQYDLLTTLYIGDNAERTLMRSILEDNPWTHFTRRAGGSGSPLMIHRVLELSSDITTSFTNDRMVVGLKHPRVAEMGIAFMPRVLKILDKGREICAQVESKFSPTFMKRPETMFYRTAI